MKYDSAAWHYNGHFPKELPPEAGATHIGMFLAWAISKDLISDKHSENFNEDLESVRKREITGRDYLIKNCSSQLSEEDLSEIGQGFAYDFYCDDEGYKEYIEIYDKTFCKKLASFYEVRDSWDNFDKIKVLIDKSFQKWMASGGRK